MPNNSDKIRDKLYDEYEDSLFRLVMHEAAEQEGRLLLEENERLKRDPEFLPSEESAKRFEKLLKAHLRKDKGKSRRKFLYKAVNRVAVAVLAVVITFSVAMVSVQAFRVKVLNLLIDVEERYTSFQLTEDDASGSGKPSVNWTNEYMPAYIPDGYEVSDSKNLDSIKSIMYKNAADQVIMYKEFSSGTNLAVDSENASRNEKIDINGNAGNLIVKNSMASVVWQMDGKLFLVQGETSPDEAVKIAESVKLSD